MSSPDPQTGAGYILLARNQFARARGSLGDAMGAFILMTAGPEEPDESHEQAAPPAPPEPRVIKFGKTLARAWTSLNYIVRHELRSVVAEAERLDGLGPMDARDTGPLVANVAAAVTVVGDVITAIGAACMVDGLPNSLLLPIEHAVLVDQFLRECINSLEAAQEAFQA